MASGSSGGGYLCYSYGWFCGDSVAPAQFYRNDGTQYTNLSALRVVDHRSTGGADLNGTATSTYPALNIGQGDYAPAATIAIATGAAFSAGATTITTASTTLNSAIIMPGMGVIDTTTGSYVGTVASCSGTTLTLTAPGTVNAGSSRDTLAFSAAYGKAATSSCR